MSDPTRGDALERDLWRGLSRAGPPQADENDACLDASDLAAYVDGRARGEDLAHIESHLAVCDRCLAAVRDARALVAQPAGIVPTELLSRVKALVPAGAAQPAAARPKARRRIGSWVGLAGGEGAWKTALRWACAAAAAALVGLAGFLAGSATYRSRQAADAKLVAEVSFELADPAKDDLLLLGDDLQGLLPAEGGAK